ncbi:fumarylacetoacetate hydrolase family protein [Leucobacter sp. CSA1]|uniref:Fumarylacetoacetate hydrolase family protein n=1 Tax=Leucobacter chromiisoli TaxID=2796471 RepID=A0A934QA20_9MICO|nr:fumarylacetoacetate hydrolase family protein [Leucobacter chromiisoli]MBK0419379.1 fumarylacetoacetate hydrolase family protein [Leucobacter chromiisoli]
MRIATIEHGGSTTAVRVDEGRLTPIDGYADAGELLATGRWEQLAAEASGPSITASDAVFLPPVLEPGKILCIGLNYRKHILEMGRELPEYPSVFAKFPETLTGAAADVESNPLDSAMDWEGELAFVIGDRAYRVDETAAESCIAGYTVANDISMRSWQNRTPEWLQGKMWARTTPVGPVLVTRDEFDLSSAVLRTTVNGETVQEEELSDLLFSPAQLIAYLSQILPLNPGDLVLTGTPGGVGHARRPQMYLHEGDTVEVEITGLGAVRNRITAPA